MKRFLVYDQRKPVLDKRTKEYDANMPEVGEVQADSAGDAIKIAIRRGMSRWPIVKETSCPTT